MYTGCLAEAAYYIESNGEAAIIDPLRETEPYVLKAIKRNAKIKYVFETHFHADFVSGHVDLANKTGASIVYGPTNLKTGFNAVISRDGQEFKIGNIVIKLIHTPGHTMESSCYLLKDETGKELALFSGDTLLIGDVGRPDLAQKVIEELTPEILAGHLYDSLRNKIMPLANDIIVYPAHGPGSACGKNMSKETYDTLGHQKEINYALNPTLSKQEFINQVLMGLTPPPAYFPYNVLLNINGYDAIDHVLQNGNKPLTVIDFEKIVQTESAVILDTRPAQTFAQGYIQNSINIGLDGAFAVWAGTLLPDLKQPIVIVAENDKASEAALRLSRVGFSNIKGFLFGGIEKWLSYGRNIDKVESITAEDFADRMTLRSLQILDVRKVSEYNSEHILNVINTPLDYINESINQLNPSETYYVYCAGGYRSMTFISILKRNGFKHLIDVKGGFKAIKDSHRFALSKYVCPTTML